MTHFRFARSFAAAVCLLALTSGCSPRPPGAVPADTATTTRQTSVDPLEAMAQSVTIYRDRFGVPHVVGPTDASVVFGAAYARAEDEFHYVEQAYIKMLGRASAVSGPDWLRWDVFMRKLEIEAHSKREYEAASAEVRALCDAFAAGMNYYLRTHPEVEPALLDHFEPWYALAGYRLFHVSGIGGATLEQLGEPGVLDVFNGYLASTAWAVGPSKSASGHPMLMINPHIPLDAPYEYSLHSEQGLRISGQVAYGIGILPISGHNGDSGWGITANEPDITDVYAETFDESDPLLYRYGTAWRRALTWDDVIEVRTKTGREDRAMRFAKTHHGPLFDGADDRRLALKVAKLAEGGILRQFYDMARAEDLPSFKEAIAPMSLTYNNIVYAGRDGHIFYVYGGAIAKRAERFDWTQPVDGSDPATEWGRYFTLDELPQVENPAAGYVQNSNSSPFFTTDGHDLDPASFPAYMFRGERDTGIARRSRRLLSDAEAITFDDWSEMAFDTYLPTAADDIARLRAELADLRAVDADGARRFEEPMELLHSWDRRARADSVASALYLAFFHTDPSSSAHPMLDRLAQALDSLERAYGSWLTPHGEITRLQRLDPARGEAFGDDLASLPVPGIPFYTGAVFTFNTTTPDGSPYAYGRHGHSYVGVVEFSEPVRARSVLAFGQSRDRQSPHYFDQAPLYARGQMKTAHFALDAMAEQALRTYRPGSQRPPAR